MTTGVGRTPKLAAAVPYVVRLEKDSELVKWISEGYSQHWGIFAVARANLRVMRNHFRELFIVQDSQGEWFYFRFYDPRVLRIYLPTCHAQERNLLFGPVLLYLVEADDALNNKVLLHFLP